MHFGDDVDHVIGVTIHSSGQRFWALGRKGLRLKYLTLRVPSGRPRTGNPANIHCLSMRCRLLCVTAMKLPLVINRMGKINREK